MGDKKGKVRCSACKKRFGKNQIQKTYRELWKKTMEPIVRKGSGHREKPEINSRGKNEQKGGEHERALDREKTEENTGLFFPEEDDLGKGEKGQEKGPDSPQRVIEER